MDKQFAILNTGAIIFVLHVKETQAPINKNKQRERPGVIYGVNLNSPTLRVNNYLVNNTKKVLPIDDLMKGLKSLKDYNFGNTKHHPGHVTAKRYKAIVKAILEIKAPAPAKKEHKKKTA